MNSCYGKTIEKPINRDWKYIHNPIEAEKYALRNYIRIVDRVKINDSNINAFKVKKPIDQHFNFSLLGIQVLSMSKRIMNEVMCLAYDLGCHIYYQDTDSMHIEVDDLNKLKEGFYNKYQRDLIGGNLGQFHSDFTSDEGQENVKYAIESYFLMKKTYIDKLQLEDDSIAYMTRAKGITKNARYARANESYNGNVMEMYKALFNGEEIEFDLTKGQPQFEMNKDMTITNRINFLRKLKTQYEIGYQEEYFNI